MDTRAEKTQGQHTDDDTDNSDETDTPQEGTHNTTTAQESTENTSAPLGLVKSSQWGGAEKADYN